MERENYGRDYYEDIGDISEDEEMEDAAIEHQEKKEMTNQELTAEIITLIIAYSQNKNNSKYIFSFHESEIFYNQEEHTIGFHLFDSHEDIDEDIWFTYILDENNQCTSLKKENISQGGPGRDVTHDTAKIGQGLKYLQEILCNHSPKKKKIINTTSNQITENNSGTYTEDHREKHQ